MNTPKHFLTALLFALLSLHVSAQDYFYLEDVKLSDKSDYQEHKDDLVKAVDYLMTSLIDDQNMDRKACIRFVIRYSQGTPDVTVTLSSYIGDLYKKNEDFLPMYLGLWVKSALESADKPDEHHEKYILSALAKYCIEGNNVSMTKTLKKLVKAEKDGKIDDFLKSLKE